MKTSLFALCFLLNTLSWAQEPYAVTNHVGKSFPRLGDRLMSYVKAKWIAYSYGYPFYYHPFPYSDQFVFDVKEKLFTSKEQRLFRSKILIKTSKRLSRKKYSQRCLLLADKSFQESDWERGDDISLATSLIDDAVFIQELKSLISPLSPLSAISPPSIPSVAIHIRCGGGYDPEDCVKKWPTKFPPIEYFAEQLQILSKMIDHEPLYAFVFTDDSNPEEVAKKLALQVQLNNITYDYRKEGNHHDNNVLIDLFSIANFDYLIRSRSYFAQIAQLVGNHKIVFYPKLISWQKGQVQIDDVGIFFSKEQETLNEKIIAM